MTKIFTISGLIAGIVVAYFSFSALNVLCEFSTCKVTAYLLPVLIIIVLTYLGYVLDKFLKKKTL